MRRRLAIRGAIVAGTVGIAELFFGLVLGFYSYDPEVRVAGTAVAVAIGIAVGYFAFRPPGDTIQDVSDVANAIARGELDKRVPGGGGPTGELVHHFNTMAQRLEEAFDETNAGRVRVEAVLAATTDAMIAIAADTTVRYMNPAAVDLLRVAREDAVGRPFIESARDYELDALVREAIAPPRTTETQVVTFGPNRIPLRAVAVPISGGGEWSVLLLLNDLTEVQRLDQVRRDFLSNVSHELRTPLASARALVETMQDDPEASTEDRAAFLERIQQQIERMTLLVNELLDLSRIESGAIELQPEELDLTEIVAEATQLLRPRIEQDGIEIVLPEDRHVYVEADRTALVRIVNNLLDNAVKYGQPGGHVWVEFREEGDLVALAVQDEGPGIAQHDLPRVFERFYKAEQSRTSQGVGLGLAIVKHLVRAHGGTAEASSPPEGGAVFTVRLPRKFVGTHHESTMPGRGARPSR
ncbi:MAG: ATP-binding protein [Dehalococcoidia bacterium]|nr:ATP-binding protein [Dehalococcoidia bacterium]